MGLDIRTPIGMMFAIFGLLLAGYGLIGDQTIYATSLGHNINLIWGIVLLLFGALMWFFGTRKPDATATKPLGESNTEPRRGH